MSNYNHDVIRFINWYKSYYQTVKGIRHPYIKNEQLQRVHDTLLEYCECNSVDILESLPIMAESFFDKVKQSDHNINHFATPGMLEVRFYDSGLY